MLANLLPTEEQFETSIYNKLLTEKNGYTKLEEKYNPELALYPKTLVSFIKATQPNEWNKFELFCDNNPTIEFCNCLKKAINTNGIIYVLQEGFRCKGTHFRICYFKPKSTLNQHSFLLYKENICSCVRQWKYSSKNNNAVDMVLVINGIPLIAIELKSQKSEAFASDAVVQWKTTRAPSEPCFSFNKRIIAYLAVDLTDASISTSLKKQQTIFLPFNQGSNGLGNDGGYGNPANPDGYATDYLWDTVFTKDGLLNIIQNFIHVDKKKKEIIFPRMHQLDAVQKLINHVKEHGAGHNYLIQHSAGSGKTKTITWTALQLANLMTEFNTPVFSSIIIISDRIVIDAQLQNSLLSINRVNGVVNAIDDSKTSKDLTDALNNGDRIIVTTIHKFAKIHKEITKKYNNNFAIIIDEAHSSQGGSLAGALKAALTDISIAKNIYENATGENIDNSDDKNLINNILLNGQQKNLSYFAFTATPHSDTLELFGTNGHPFHIYSMRQAIEEKYIMNPLRNYTTYDTYVKIMNKTSKNPNVVCSQALNAINNLKNADATVIEEKTKIIIERFLSVTINSINGKGKMMVLAPSRKAAISYFFEINKIKNENGYSCIKPMVAFSDSVDFNGKIYTEENLNQREDGSFISSKQLKDEFHDNFNILIVAEKFQTGFDEPLLHTLIVDTKLTGIKCVQSISRINRIHPEKKNTHVFDFVNTASEIRESFQKYYTETQLLDDSDLENIIDPLLDELHDFNVYTNKNINDVIEVYEKNYGKSNIGSKMQFAYMPCINKYNEMPTDIQKDFKSKINMFLNIYSHLILINPLYDKNLHKEYIFCQNLTCFLKTHKSSTTNVSELLQLKDVNIEMVFEGNIKLNATNSIVLPHKFSSHTVPDKEEPLNEIINRINLIYSQHGIKQNAITSNLFSPMIEKLKQDSTLRKFAKQQPFEIFKEDLFSEAFRRQAHKGYMDADATYTELFQNGTFFNEIVDILAKYMYDSFQK